MPMRYHDTSYIFSLRRSVVRGWYWKRECEVLPENQLSWLAMYQQDEPSVVFHIARVTPPLPEDMA